MPIPANLDLESSRKAYWTATVGANNLSADELYKKFLEIKTGLSNKSFQDMEIPYWKSVSGSSNPNLSSQDYQNLVFNPYQSEELYWLRAQP
jgi:hypothetical protein